MKIFSYYTRLRHHFTRLCPRLALPRLYTYPGAAAIGAAAATKETTQIYYTNIQYNQTIEKKNKNKKILII